MTRFFRTTSTLSVTAALALLGPVAPAQADSKLGNALKGLGAAIIINEMAKGSKKNGSASAGSNTKPSGGSGGGGGGGSVAQTQRALAELGYDPGPVDGQMGGKTRAAIQAFQSDRGYPVTGKLTTEQFAALNSAYSMLATPPAAGQMTTESTYEAQVYLNKLGYDVGAPDGVWGPKSQAALDSYRAGMGMGSVGALSLADVGSLHMQVHGAPAPDISTLAAGNLGLGGGGLDGGTLSLGGQQQGSSPGLTLGGGEAGDGSGLTLGGNQQQAQLGLGENQPLGLAKNTPLGLGADSQIAIGQNQQLGLGQNGLGQNQQTGLGQGGLGQNQQPGLGQEGQPQLAAIGQQGVGQQQNAGQGSTEGFTASQGELAQPGTIANTTAKATVQPSDYVHLSDRAVEGMPKVDRLIALHLLKARPTLVDDQHNLLQWFRVDHPRGQNPSAMRLAYDNGNQIEKQDVLRKFHQNLLAEVASTPALSDEKPLPIAFYQPVQIGEYVDGVGLKLNGQNIAPFEWQYRTRYLNASAVLRADMPGTATLKITRDEARQVIDFVDASKQRLFRVVWGQVLNIGEDKTVASFAKSTGAGWQQVATTFSVDKVTLGLAPGGYKEQPQIERTIYTFDMTRSPKSGKGAPVLAYLQQRGVPMMNGHVLMPAGQAGQNAIRELAPNHNQSDPAIERVAYLTWLAQNPEFAEKDMNFISVAARLMNDAEKRQFFGDGAKNLPYYQSGMSYDQAQQYGHQIFPDEFAAQDAKRAFLSSYYPRVLATAPQWPAPTIQVLGARLGKYDFDNQHFPIQYDGYHNNQPQTARVASMRTMVSADRLGPLPQKLEMTIDEARALREVMGGGDRVYLAWTAQLDMGQDGSELETQFDPSGNLQRQTNLRPGRAKIDRIALFRDRGLSKILQEYDPAAMVMSPKFEAPIDPGAGAEGIIANMKLAEPHQLLKASTTLLQNAALETEVIKMHNSVRTANEFDVEERIAEVRQFWAGVPAEDFWFQGTARLGRYDRDQEIFPFAENQGNQRLNMGRENLFNASVAPQIVGNNLFEPLSIKEDVAREIVTGEMRDVQFYVRVRPISAAPVANRNNQFTLMVQPIEVIYVQPRLASGSILQHRKFDGDNFFEETFTAEDFPELKERLPFDLGTMQLLWVKSMTNDQLDANLDNLMAETFYYETQRGSFVPERFFADVQRYDPAKLAIYRDRYRNWITARAEALGNRFTVTHMNEVSGWECRGTALVRSNYDVLAGYGVDTGAMLASSAKIETIAATEGDGETATDHMYFAGRIMAPNRNCDPRAGVGSLSVEGVGFGGAIGTNQPFHYTTRQVDFDLTGQEISVTNKGIPHLRLEAIATETRYFDAHYQNIAGAIPTITLANDAYESPAPEKIEQAAFSENATDRAKIAPIWPEVADIAFSNTGFDTVGIRIGMPMDEAEALVRAEFNVSVGFESPEPTGEGEAAFDYVRVFFIDGASQAVSLLSYAPDGPVLAVNRHLLRSDAPWPQSAITASLVEKYGEPTARASDDSTIVWAKSEECAYMPLSPIGTRSIDPLNDGANDGELNAKLAAAIMESIARIADDSAEFLEQNAACGETMMYSADLLSPVEGYHGFFTFMTDLTAVKSVADALAPKEEPKVKIKF